MNKFLKCYCWEKQ